LPEETCTVAGDAELLRQVLSNLAENALDAMPDGGTLSFECEREGKHVVVRVTDSGTGMPPEHRSKVLFPFFTTKRDRGGTGLGLYEAYRIVRRHGGTLELESEEGLGTTITLKFPFLEGPEPERPDQI
jgi:signal transduction histidine kinase